MLRVECGIVFEEPGLFSVCAGVGVECVGDWFAEEVQGFGAFCVSGCFGFLGLQGFVGRSRRVRVFHGGALWGEASVGRSAVWLQGFAVRASGFTVQL